jgi:hypothetical protein
MIHAALPPWPAYLFPFFFIALWVGASAVLGFLSGWFELRQWYADDGSEAPLLKLGGQSGSMGAGVGLRGVLKLLAYPSGLGVRISPLFGPFQRPLKIPWGEIDAEPGTRFFAPVVKLSLGRGAKGTLKISARTWSRLVDAVPQAGGLGAVPMPAAFPASRLSVARAMLLQWAAMTAFAGAFFFLAPRLNGTGQHLPLGVCIGFPAILFGFAQLVHYVRQR